MQWRAIGSSVTGDLHVQNGRGCEDAHGWILDDRLSVVVTADGAGSRPGLSAIGAHVAVATVLAASRRPSFQAAYCADAAAAVTSVFHEALDRVSAAAAEIGSIADDLATTLSVATIGEGEIVVAQVGDGIAVVESAEGSIEAVAIAERFEYANEVVFITSDRALADHLKLDCRPAAEISGLALSTDGLRYKILDDLQTTTPYEQFYRDTWSYARAAHARSDQIEAFLAGVDDQTGDDKTLVVGVRGIEGEAVEVSRLSSRPPVPQPPATQADKSRAPLYGPPTPALDPSWTHDP
jgi:hypothetical protein